MSRRTVIIEPPDSSVLVDFVDIGTVTVSREKRAGRWCFVVNVKTDNADGYSWTEREHAFPCPVRKVRR